MQFLRDDVAQAVNALNNRLNAIQGIVSGAEEPHPAAVQREIDGAKTITNRLLHRVDNTAPAGVPAAYVKLRDRKVRKAHILVIEDDESNRTVIAKLFRRLGHRVTPASNGVEGMEILRQGSVDCVICDLRMPHLSGKTLFEQVERGLPNMASRFVFVTGDATRPESRAFLESSGQPVIPKPYEADSLLAAVADILGRVGVITADKEER